MKHDDDDDGDGVASRDDKKKTSFSILSPTNNIASNANLECCE